MSGTHAAILHDLEPARPECPTCGYDLRATVTISGARCPECGAALPFDALRFPGEPSRARVVLGRATRALPRPAWPGRWFAGIVVLLPAALGMVVTGAEAPRLAALAGLYAAMMVAGHFALPREPAWQPVAIAVVVAVAGATGQWSKLLLLAPFMVALVITVPGHGMATSIRRCLAIMHRRGAVDST